MAVKDKRNENWFTREFSKVTNRFAKKQPYFSGGDHSSELQIQSQIQTQIQRQIQVGRKQTVILEEDHSLALPT